MNNQIYWGQTIGAAIVSVVVFFLLLYVSATIIESLLNIYGVLFVPERYGGGGEIDNPDFLTLAFRAILASSLAAVGACLGWAICCCWIVGSTKTGESKDVLMCA